MEDSSRRESTKPETVDIDERRVTVRWEDEHTSPFDLVALRRACPCAQCNEFRSQGHDVWPKPGDPEPLRVEAAETVGAWGLSLRWNDRHETGIFTWRMLRAACPCGECRSNLPAEDPGG